MNHHYLRIHSPVSHTPDTRRSDRHIRWRTSIGRTAHAGQTQRTRIGLRRASQSRNGLTPRLHQPGRCPSTQLQHGAAPGRGPPQNRTQNKTKHENPHPFPTPSHHAHAPRFAHPTTRKTCRQRGARGASYHLAPPKCPNRRLVVVSVRSRVPPTARRVPQRPNNTFLARAGVEKRYGDGERRCSCCLVTSPEVRPTLGAPGRRKPEKAHGHSVTGAPHTREPAAEWKRIT